MFHAQSDDGRTFVIFEYTEYHYFERDETLIKVPTSKFFETAQGDEVRSYNGRFEIADMKLIVQECDGRVHQPDR
jgi:hypothetical protein